MDLQKEAASGFEMGFMIDGRCFKKHKFACEWMDG